MNNGREITKNYKHEWVHKLANGTQRSFFEESYMKKAQISNAWQWILCVCITSWGL